jgi:hypothetical protein
MKIKFGIFLCQFLLAGFVWGFAGGDGSEGNPWQIANRSELESVNSNLTAHYILINDIDLGGTNYTNAVIAPWEGSSRPAFSGVFDGNYKTIHNLCIDGGTTNSVIGLFSVIEHGGIIKKLRLDNCNVSGKDFLGMISGSLEWGVIISDCFASGAVSGQDSVGGLVGQLFQSCIRRSASEGSVVGMYSVGGLVGENEGDQGYDYRSGVISDCYSTCTVSGGSAVGGLIGWNRDGDMFNCYSCGVVSGDSETAALVGNPDMRSSIYHCFWNKDTSGQTQGSPWYYGGEGITSEEMSQQSTFSSVGWVFGDPEKGIDGIWYMPKDGFPRLYRWSGPMLQVPEVLHLNLPEIISALAQTGFTIGVTNYVNSLTLTNGAIAGISAKEGEVYPTNAPPIDIYISLGPAGDGSEGTPFPVACESDLMTVNSNLTAHYKLVRDIYMTNQYITAVVANQGISFTGVFDGNGKKLVGLRIEVTSDRNHLGLFGKLGAGGLVKNLRLQDIKIYCAYYLGWTSRYVSATDGIGGVVGYLKGTVSGCSFSGLVCSDQYCGGVVGYNDSNGLIEKSCFKGHIYCGLYGGGVVGGNEGTIEFCYALGAMCSENESGGFVGLNYSYGIIRDCYSLTFGYNAAFGGFAGCNNSGTIQRSYSCGSRSFNDFERAAGFVRSGSLENITDCFWNLELNPYFANVMYDAPTGTNTLAMQTQSTYTDAGWSFYENSSGRVDGWYMPENDYPALFWQSEYFLICPSLDGLSLVDMQSALVDAGFTLGFVIHTNSLTVAAGEIIGASVASGCSYLTNAPPVDIYISSGIGGDGTESAPYPIACESDLQSVNNDLSAHYYLVHNIDLQKTYSDTVIGSRLKSLYYFTGSLDGRDNVLAGLNIEGGSYDAGLFLELRTGAVVKNLNIENAEVGTDASSGILASHSRGTVIISNCYVQGCVQGDYGVGGLVGSCDGDDSSGAEISHCRASVWIAGSAGLGGLIGESRYGKIISSSASGCVTGGENLGGLVGCVQYGRIEDSFAECVVKGTGGSIGGLVGEFSEGTAEGCFASGSVFGGDWNVGGLFGVVYDCSFINGCFSLGPVSGTDSVGGFCGDLYNVVISNSYSLCAVSGSEHVGGFSGSIDYSTVCNCYCSGTVEGDNFGGFTARLYSSTATSCFWDVEASGVSISTAGIGTNTVAMQDEATFINAGWDFTNVWYMAGYPKLREFVESSEDEYQLWLFDSGAPAGARGQLDDPAGDNIPNLLKYAAGLDPLTYCSTADLMLPELEQSERKFTITYQRSKDAAGVSLYPTWSASLISSDWQSDGFEFQKLSETTTTELWEVSLSLDDNPSAFIRLNADLTEE